MFDAVCIFIIIRIENLLSNLEGFLSNFRGNFVCLMHDVEFMCVINLKIEMSN